MMKRAAVSLVGVGDDGCVGLSARGFNAVTRAQVLCGAPRHLQFFPDFSGQKVTLANGLKSYLDDIERLSYEHNVCILASGDPLFYGIGAMVAERLGRDHLEVVPHPSSMQWAFARLGLKWDQAQLYSVHGRSMEGFIGRLQRTALLACFTDADHSPRRLASVMLEYGETAWDIWVCEHLCGTEERVRLFSVDELAACADVATLNVAVFIRRDKAWRQAPELNFAPEDDFAKRMPKAGLITKREVRLLSMAYLRVSRDSVVWDIGAGSGAVAIEAAKLAYDGRVYAIECDPEGVDICAHNILAHKVGNVRVIHGMAPAPLRDLEAPDCVFIGGSKGNMDEIIRVSYGALKPRGALVVNAVTVENVVEASETFKALGLKPELIVASITRGVPLAGKYLKYEALNPVHIFSVGKPMASAAAPTQDEAKA